MFKIIKTQLEGAKGIWLDELPSILWVYRTIARTPTGETPFQLAYGSDAVIPAEVGLTNFWVENYTEDKNDEAIRLRLDLVDEVCVKAEQRLVRYQNLVAKHYNSNVRHRDFQVGDLVLRKVIGATRDPLHIGKDLTGSRHCRGRARTTLRHWTDENFSIHGTRSTYGNTTSRDDVKNDDIPQFPNLFNFTATSSFT